MLIALTCLSTAPNFSLGGPALKHSLPLLELVLRDLTSGEALGQDLPSVGPAPFPFSFRPVSTRAPHEEDHQGHETAPEDQHH
jgi:hypothetical protein